MSDMYVRHPPILVSQKELGSTCRVKKRGLIFAMLQPAWSIVWWSVCCFLCRRYWSTKTNWYSYTAAAAAAATAPAAAAAFYRLFIEQLIEVSVASDFCWRWPTRRSSTRSMVDGGLCDHKHVHGPGSGLKNCCCWSGLDHHCAQVLCSYIFWCWCVIPTFTAGFHFVLTKLLNPFIAILLYKQALNLWTF